MIKCPGGEGDGVSKVTVTYKIKTKRRKPELMWRSSGGSDWRYAEVAAYASMFQPPPRRTRFSPEDGPRGSIAADEV